MIKEVGEPGGAGVSPAGLPTLTPPPHAQLTVAKDASACWWEPCLSGG